MALSTFTDLKSAVADWLARNGDAALTTRAPDFITLCEDRVHHGSGEPKDPDYIPPLRIQPMETRATSPVTSGDPYLDLPTGFLQMHRLQLNTDPVVQLSYVNPEELLIRSSGLSNGKPTIYTIVDEQVQFERSPDSAYVAEMLYWKKFNPLSDAAPTNWLLTNAPRVYLNGALAEAAEFIQNWAAFDRYDLRYRKAVTGLQTSNDRAKFGGELLAAKPLGITVA